MAWRPDPGWRLVSMSVTFLCLKSCNIISGFLNHPSFHPPLLSYPGVPGVGCSLIVLLHLLVPPWQLFWLGTDFILTGRAPIFPLAQAMLSFLLSVASGLSWSSSCLVNFKAVSQPSRTEVTMITKGSM